MVLPSTQPLDGEFWYVLDGEDNIVWRPRSKLRGNFYLGWLGQNRDVVGAGLALIEQGQLTRICTHGTPYYWLQPFEVLPLVGETLQDQHMLGADTAVLDFSLAGWKMRDQTSPQTRQWPGAPIPSTILQPLLSRGVAIIARNFRSEGDPVSKSEFDGLLDRALGTQPGDPLEELLDLLEQELGQPNVVPVLAELVRHDINVLPGYRQSSFFEELPSDVELPSPTKAARLMLSAVYHLAPLLGSRRLHNALLLNSLRQRHPFDVAWGADFIIKCFDMPGLVRLLLVALAKEENDQVRGNVLDLLQELGYGFSADLEDEVLSGLAGLRNSRSLEAFGQVIDSHLAFMKEYWSQRDAAATSTG